MTTKPSHMTISVRKGIKRRNCAGRSMNLSNELKQN